MSKQSNTLLLTGATGFVGRHLTGLLDSKILHVAVRNQVLNTDHEAHVIGDIADYDQWQSLFEGIDVVIHLAARVHQRNCDDVSAYEHDNTLVIKRMAAAAVKAGVRRFIFISTIKVNGQATYGQPFKPSDTLAPINPYEISKANAEQLLLETAHDSDLEVVIIRPPLVYGPGVKANFEALWSLASSRMLLPFAKVNNRRDMVSVYNLCDLIVTCIDCPAAKNSIFLVSDGRPYSLAEIITAMRRVRGRSAGLLNIPIILLKGIFRVLGKKSIGSRLLDDLEVDISETKAVLNWQPKLTLDQTLKKMLAD